ncbi:MAG: hypothetical protein QOF83_1536 [Solirubrobacteraceae bacterium]|jgi:hypothetical protein|nr:hypothetical protein [Solirubrobacteraceae bacterium]
MRRLAVALLAAASLVVGIPASASAGPSGSPGCYGQFVSSYAQNPALLGASNLGQFVSTSAQTAVPFGQTSIPLYKTLACG